MRLRSNEHENQLFSGVVDTINNGMKEIMKLYNMLEADQLDYPF